MRRPPSRVGPAYVSRRMDDEYKTMRSPWQCQAMRSCSDITEYSAAESHVWGLVETRLIGRVLTGHAVTGVVPGIQRSRHRRWLSQQHCSVRDANTECSNFPGDDYGTGHRSVDTRESASAGEGRGVRDRARRQVRDRVQRAQLLRQHGQPRRLHHLQRRRHGAALHAVLRLGTPRDETDGVRRHVSLRWHLVTLENDSALPAALPYRTHSQCPHVSLCAPTRHSSGHTGHACLP